MKSILLLLLFVLVHTSQAQYFANGSLGFEANYLPDNPTSSCLTSFPSTTGGYYYTGGNVLNVSMGSGLPLTILTNSSIQPPSNSSPAYFDLMYIKGEGMAAQCVSMRQEYDNTQGDYYHVDLSENGKVVVLAKSDIPNTLLNVHLAYAANAFPVQSTYTDDITKTITLSTTMTAYELDFSEWANRDRVNMVGLYIGEANATVTIEKISMGLQFWSTFANHIKGNVYSDTNGDCLKQTGETGLANFIVEATDGNIKYWGYSNVNGDYDIAVDSGTITYAVTPHLNARSINLVENLCTPSRLVSASGSGLDFCCSDFAFKITPCALLSVEVTSDRRRRCFRSGGYVNYYNYGTASSAATVVKVVYPEFIVPISSVPEWSSKVGDTLIYQLGTLAAGARGDIYLVDSVICGREDIRGLSQCLKAIISPKSQCVSNEPAWDHSSVTVFPYCEEGVARFVVQNVGLEDMTGPSAYRLYSNDTLIFQSTFQLLSGNTFQVRYPANGAVIRLEADQRPSHPGRSQPRAFVEGCGTSAAQTSVASESLVLSVPQDDLDEDVAITCLTILDSFDPNDKAALPVGITDDHLVKAGQRLQYTIRFQNTGTDVAYKIVVVDTLDANLDIASFVEGTSSHAYTLKLLSLENGQVEARYLFNNINLKDSTTSEPESHGFVSFYISSKDDLSDGNTIHNKADIFFDYNSAIVTNVVDHTIGTYVPTDLSKGNKVEITTGLFEGNESGNVQRVILYPNPASDVIQVKLQKQITDAQLRILDLSGHEVYSGNLKGEITSVSLSGLSSGMYMYKVMSNGEYVGVGKLIVR